MTLTGRTRALLGDRAKQSLLSRTVPADDHNTTLHKFTATVLQRVDIKNCWDNRASLEHGAIKPHNY
jgi:hypothetical protein